MTGYEQETVYEDEERKRKISSNLNPSLKNSRKPRFQKTSKYRTYRPSTARQIPYNT
jgi:hypothetical protein